MASEYAPGGYIDVGVGRYDEGGISATGRVLVRIEADVCIISPDGVCRRSDDAHRLARPAHD
jgi:hypothetical protein